MSIVSSAKKIPFDPAWIHKSIVKWYKLEEGKEPPAFVDMIVIVDIWGSPMQYQRMVYWDRSVKAWCDSFMDGTIKDLGVVYYCPVPTLPTTIY
jgi:hypothetical protein